MQHQGSLAERSPSVGILMANLGTPDAPTPAAVRRYLAQFLSDPRVIEASPWLWQPILHGVVLRLRPRRAARAYRTIWTEEGSPLVVIARRQATALQSVLERRCGPHVIVAPGMRYGSPSIAEALQHLREARAERILVLPLYPQYSATTTASTFDAVASTLRGWRALPELRMINAYWYEPGYIGALAESIRAYWQRHGRGDRLLMSFHGLPKEYVEAGDPYERQCQATAERLAAELGLSADAWQLSFQSRFGPRQWLTPYTDRTLVKWGKAKLARVDVIAPGFAADCLETLEELAQLNRRLFRRAGGGDYHYIPALNDTAGHIDFLADLVVRHCHGWSGVAGARPAVEDPGRKDAQGAG